MPTAERCARCDREAPPPDVGPEGQVDQGWVTYAGSPVLVIDVPYPDPSLLPDEVATAVRGFDGLVKIEPDPQVDLPAVREIVTSYLGIACSDCREATGWNDDGWQMFMAGLDPSG